MNKKGIVGIGVLIVFIAGVLIAAIGAGTIITTQNKLQQTALATGRDAESSVTTSILVQKVNVIDNKETSPGKYGFHTIEMKVRIAAGGEPINLHKTTIELATPNGSGTINYGGDEYFTTKKKRLLDFEINSTPQKFKTDFDRDLEQDEIYVLDPNTIRIQFSMGEFIDITTPSLTVIGNVINITEPIIQNGYVLGELSINAIISKVGTIPENTATINVVDYGFGKYYTKHLLGTKITKMGALQQGEILQIIMETPIEVGSTETVNLLFFNQRGLPELTLMYTPEVMLDQHFTLFPVSSNN